MGDEDDDEEGTPTSYTFSPESKLDEDHLFLLQFTNNFISNVSRPRDFDHCTRWLEKLAGEPMYGVEAKRNRNMFLAMLLIAMQDNKVKGPFSTFPPSGTLPHAGDAFGLTPEEEREGHVDLNMEAFDRELNMEDYRYKSTDNRTYVALSKLPNGFGCMGYVGLTIGGGEGLWLNREGEKVSLTDVMKNDVIPSITTQTPVQKQIDMITGFNWSDPPDLPDEAVPFDFLAGLPESRSDTSLVEVKGAHRMSVKSKRALLDEYPPELVEMLSRLMEKNKKHFDEIMRTRHSKVVNQIYEAYKTELERGLNEYKLARKEWQMVISVIQDFKELDKAIAKKAAESSGGDQGSSKSAKVLMNALQEAQKRKRKCLDDSGKLDNVKGEIHKIIHTRILEHKAELGVVDGQVQQLLDEIKRLRGDAKRKKMVIEGLVHELELYHEMG